MSVAIPEGVPEEAAARKALAFESVRRRLVAGRTGRIMLAIWGFVVAGLFLGSLAGVLGASVAIALAALGAAWMERSWARSAADGALAGSLAEISLGRLPEAEGILSALREAFWMPRALARRVAIQGALVATRRGELDRARESLDEALARNDEADDVEAALERDEALALRAFVLAASGDSERARADIEAVRARDAGDEALARASLAEALLLQQAGERPALRALLELDRPLLRESCHPRERVMVRALERWCRAPKVTPYRHAEAAPSPDEPPVETWVERVAPALAGFVETHAGTTLTHSPLGPNLVAPPPTQAGLRAIRDARLARTSPLWPLVAIAGGAFGAMALLLVMSSPQGGLSQSDGSAVGPTALIVALVVGVMFIAARRATSKRRATERATLARAAGRALDRRVMNQIGALAASGDGRTAAHAHLVLAEAAERAGRWNDVLERTAAGLQRIARRGDLPDIAADLISLRALALAARDRHGEAEAELAALPRRYPHAPRAIFRARLVDAVRRGKMGPALEHVERYASDLPLSIREETMADLVRIVSRAGAASADAARLAADLAREPELRDWLVSVAPTLVAQFEETGSTGAVRVAPRLRRIGETCQPPDAVAEARLEEQQLADVVAESECHQGSSSASTARLTS